MPTEQASFDTLLAGEIPPPLREAVTRLCPHDNSAWRDTAGLEPFCPDCGAEGVPNAEAWALETRRAPLPLDSAIVAAIRWATVEQGWLVHFDQGGVEVHRPVGLGSYHRLEEHYGPDIFSAIGAAFKGGE